MSDYQCPLCGGRLNNAEDLRKHMEQCPPPN